MATTAIPERHEAVLRLRAAGVSVDDSVLTRSLYAHDASNYRIQPTAVAFPRTVDDVVVIVRACAETGLPITPRGAGTGMAGNSVGSGMVIEFRRHMNSVRAVDEHARTAVVEPGVVLDDVQAIVAKQGLMFGPDPSSHSRATFGGMIGNDACGNHSVAYGRTSDHVVQLDLVLADGTRAVATRTGIRAVDPAHAARVADVADQLRDIATRFATELETEFARSPRQVSGYAAHQLLERNGFDIARLLVGSEGTLAVVVSATVALVDLPRNKQLLVLGYPDLIAGARDVPALLAHQPSAIEALDEAIVATMRQRRGDRAVPELPEGNAWLFVEFADTVATADLNTVREQILTLGNAISATPVADADARSALWRVREDGAGLASSLLDGTRGRPGWEDASVPPHRLAEYLEGLATLQAKHGFTGVLYGHFGAGCVHVRFDFDTASTSGREVMRAFIRDAAQLVAHCGGSVSGEHGDGRARGELLEIMYSPAAREAFAAIKTAFDPHGVFNPRVIVDPPSLTDDMPTPVHSAPAVFALHGDHGDLGLAAGRCVGIARCVSTGINAMCPTFDVTRDEQDSTRGRAHAIQDLLNGTEMSTAEALTALDMCLSCRACATDCPTGVDMATYKSEILHQHYRRRLRPLSHYSLGWLPVIIKRVALFAAIINAVLATPVLASGMARLLGLSATRRLPRLASRSERTRMRSLAAPAEPRALLYVDPLTQGFEPTVAEAAVAVLNAAGVPVRVVIEGDTGLTWITTGQLDAAREVQGQLLDIFAKLPAAIPVIVLEPSCAATLVHDLPELHHDERAKRLASRVRTFTQALDELAPQWTLPSRFPMEVVLQPHCHERATFTGASQAEWLRSRGVTVTEAIGCCGMGGNFGYEPGHESMSIAVAHRSLIPAIDAAAERSAVLADGFGCRCQIDDLRPQAEPQHLAQLLARLL